MVHMSKTPHALRKGFKRTFLQDVSAVVKFAETDLLSNREALKSFFKVRFGISEEFEIPKLSAVDIVSENKSERFHFTNSLASVLVDVNIYRFYEESLEPRINDLISFLEAIGISQVETFSLCKRNVFPGTTSNAFEVWKKAIVETFRKGNIQDLAKTAGIKDKPFKMSIEDVSKTEWGELMVPFSIEVSDSNSFKFQLDLIASSKSVMIKDLTRVGTIMNNSIFSAFTEIASDKLLELLQQEG